MPGGSQPDSGFKVPLYELLIHGFRNLPVFSLLYIHADTKIVYESSSRDVDLTKVLSFEKVCNIIRFLEFIHSIGQAIFAGIQFCIVLSLLHEQAILISSVHL